MIENYLGVDTSNKSDCPVCHSMSGWPNYWYCFNCGDLV